MSVEDDNLTTGEPDRGLPSVNGSSNGHRHLRPHRRTNKRRRPKLRKRRLLFILCGFTILAVLSAVFGMLTAVASDLPALSNRFEFQSRVDSELYSSGGKLIGTLAPPDKAVIDPFKQISPNMVHAIVSIEEKHYWTDSGISIRGLARALVSDVTGGPREGGSTIPEEFVKNVLAQEDNRTVFEKLREAGLAFQLVKRWGRVKVMDEYLNTIYFGNGAYGIEAAARTYFGQQLGYEPDDPAAETKSSCGDPDAEDKTRPSCASVLTPAQSALLAGMVANPYAFDPVLHPGAATGRRNQVLYEMWQQHYITDAAYVKAKSTPVPTAKDIQEPEEPAAAPYFVSWVRPLIVHALEQEGLTPKNAQYQAYYGGLRIKLTLNEQMQEAAQTAINDEFPPGSNGPTASLVAIDNSNGEVRAMVSGDGDYAKSPFNLATLGYRQPGSSFKMFTLAAALSTGHYSADSIFDSRAITIPYTQNYTVKTKHGKVTKTAHELFHVHNFGNEYNGDESLATATAISDNSVFAQLGTEPDVGTQRVKAYAEKMGIRSSISTTPAMILGGLTQGVSALDMAHAYETAAEDGRKVWNPTLGDYNKGAIGIASITGCKPCKQQNIANTPKDGLKHTYELSPTVAGEIDDLLHGPVDDPGGTGTAAAIPGVDVVGKTGTTSNYVDAWFVGWTPQMTVAVWVGYADSGKPMLHNFNGGPVEGGTFPAIIWHNFMVQALQIMASGKSSDSSSSSTGLDSTSTVGETSTTETTTPTTISTTATSPQRQTTTPANNGGGGTGAGAGGGTTTPATTTPVTTTPAGGTTTPSSGGGTSTSGGSGL